MKWNIVADSSCDLVKSDLDCEAFGFTTVPFTLRIGEKEYVDCEGLNTETLLDAMESCPQLGSSACPSPHIWAEEFKKAEQTIAVTISANLSGSHNSAVSAKQLVLAEQPDKKISVLDSISTGPAIALLLRHIAEMIRSGLPFEAINAEAEKLIHSMKTVFALTCFDNLVKNGRMSKLTGFIAKKLGMWGIGIGSPEGTIKIKGKARGAAGAVSFIINDLHQRGFQGKELITSHCHNASFVGALREKITELWPGADITVLKTRGLDSFYAERGGIIISYL